MKRIWISAMLLVGIFAASLAHGIYVSSITEEVIGHLEEAQSDARQEQWDSADRQLQAAQRIWEDHSNYLHNTLQHRDVDNVDLTFRETAQYLLTRKWGEFSAFNARLIEQLTLLGGAEQLTLQNVL